MGAQAPTINSTYEYGIFKLMAGNRPIDYNHVKRLKVEMKRNPDLFQSNPIQVNEHMFIIDGQHRRQAAQELGVPVYYIMAPGMTIDETRDINTTQRRWTLLDFAQSYADSGREDYKVFLQFHRKYPKLPPSVLRTILAGGQLHEMDVTFKRGEFTIPDVHEARKYIEQLEEIRRRVNIKINGPLANSFMQLWKNNSEFKHELLMQKLENEGARELLQPQNTIRACLRSIEDVYNWRSKVSTRLY